MSRTPTEIVSELLANTSNAEVVRRLMSDDATYVSLNDENADLRRMMPYVGTHSGEGPQAVIDTFSTVSKIWSIEAFEILHIFGGGNDVAVFGYFK